MKLSIIVPVYNMAADGKLEYCIRSLLNQTVEDYEILAVDDASADNSLEILRRLECENSGKLKVLASGVNLRQGGAKNIGIRAAAGEWIGIVDSDDWVSPRMYEKLLHKAEETGADVVGCDYSLVYDRGMEIGTVIRNNHENQTGILTDEKYRRLLLDSGSMVIKIYKREMIVKNQLWYPEHMFYEDNCMSPLWLLHCRHFERVPEPLYYYYQHETSTVHTISPTRCHDRMRAMELLIQKAKAYGFYEKFLPEFEYRFTELYFITTLFSCMQGSIKGKYKLAGELKRGILHTFPAFRENAYYRERMGREEKKLIDLLLRSKPVFFVYYYSLNGYRKIRKTLKNKLKPADKRERQTKEHG